MLILSETATGTTHPLPTGSSSSAIVNSLPNLLLTDYTEFRWYVDGQHRAAARLAEPDGSGNPVLRQVGIAETDALLSDFLQA